MKSSLKPKPYQVLISVLMLLLLCVAWSKFMSARQRQESERIAGENYFLAKHIAGASLDTIRKNGNTFLTQKQWSQTLTSLRTVTEGEQPHSIFLPNWYTGPQLSWHPNSRLIGRSLLLDKADSLSLDNCIAFFVAPDSKSIAVPETTSPSPLQLGSKWLALTNVIYLSGRADQISQDDLPAVLQRSLQAEQQIIKTK